MSMERLAGTAPPEPSPPLVSADSGGLAGASPAMRLQILSTEHWSLLASRSLAWNESFSRAGMFLSALSGAIVALALVAQASAFGQGFTLFALVILPAVLFVGVTTFIRLGASNYHDATCVIGMNRIRAAYLELAPDLERYFVMSAHDDARGVAVTMGIDPQVSPPLHIIAATPTVVSTLNSIIAATLAGLIALQVVSSIPVALVAGVAVGAATMVAHLAYGRHNIRRGQAGIRPLFPSPPGD
jgi:hypothetical protein